MNTRHRGRYVFFCSMRGEGDEEDAVHELLFRSTSSSGRMEDDEPPKSSHDDSEPDHPY